MTTDYIFIAAAYLDIAKADADYEVLRRAHDHSDSTDALDCVNVGRKSTGEVRLHRGPDLGRANSCADGPTWCLAAGLALALFPSIGGDIPAGQVQEREVLGVVAGVVARALGRADLHEFGSLLDSSSAGLITATTPTNEQHVGSALAHADDSMARPASVDLDAVERLARLIAARHRPRQPE